MVAYSASQVPDGTGGHSPQAAPSGAEGARRVLAVLQAFSPQRHTLTARELAGQTGIPLPSMYRYIALLRETGLLAGDDRGTYRLTPRIIGLARAAEAAETFIEIADPVMRDLAAECGETVIFVRLIARVPVCVHRVESAHHLRATFEPGQPLPLLRGASGRVLLAGLPERARRECLAPLAQADPAAAERLEETIAKVAARGWATSEEEIDRGVWAASAAVTDGRATVAALTVPSPLVRSPSALQERLLGQVRAAAARLSALIAAMGTSSGDTGRPAPEKRPPEAVAKPADQPGPSLLALAKLIYPAPTRLHGRACTVILPACRISRVCPILPPGFPRGTTISHPLRGSCRPRFCPAARPARS